MGRGLIPERMTKEELALVLVTLTQDVITNNSFGGWIEYEIAEGGKEEFMVKGTFRTGNNEGQGSVIVIGTFDFERESQ